MVKYADGNILWLFCINFNVVWDRRNPRSFILDICSFKLDLERQRMSWSASGHVDEAGN